jgi:hypothetical protein
LLIFVVQNSVIDNVILNSVLNKIMLWPFVFAISTVMLCNTPPHNLVTLNSSHLLLPVSLQIRWVVLLI